MQVQITVNLHETEFLEEALTALAESGVRDCVVREVEGVVSHHAEGQLNLKRAVHRSETIVTYGFHDRYLPRECAPAG